MSKEPFDLLRASFYLIAFVIGSHVLFTFIGLGACIWFAESLGQKALSCDDGNKLTELLSAALAAALAFAGGRSIPKGDDK